METIRRIWMVFSLIMFGAVAALVGYWYYQQPQAQAPANQPAKAAPAKKAPQKSAPADAIRTCQFGVDPVEPNKAVASNERVISLAKDEVIRMGSGSGKVYRCVAPKGTVVIADESGTATRVYSCGNPILDPLKVADPVRKAETPPAPKPTPVAESSEQETIVEVTTTTTTTTAPAPNAPHATQYPSQPQPTPYAAPYYNNGGVVVYDHHYHYPRHRHRPRVQVDVVPYYQHYGQPPGQYPGPVRNTCGNYYTGRYPC